MTRFAALLAVSLLASAGCGKYYCPRDRIGPGYDTITCQPHRVDQLRLNRLRAAGPGAIQADRVLRKLERELDNAALDAELAR